MTWIVAQTKPKLEHVAVANLQKQGYETYLPLSVEGDDAAPAPMFPGYVFVNTDPLFGLWRPVVSTRGIVRVLITGEAPSKTTARAIDTLRRREEAGVIRLKRIVAAQSFEAGQAIRVHEGAMSGFEGVFERITADDRVRIMLEKAREAARKTGDMVSFTIG